VLELNRQACVAQGVQVTLDAPLGQTSTHPVFGSSTRPKRPKLTVFGKGKLVARRGRKARDLS
jgi:hypothetical protein